MRKNTLTISQVSLLVLPRHFYTIILFLVLAITSWLSISYYLYDINLYYLHQLIPTFANIFNILLLFALMFVILYILDQIYRYFFQQKVTFSLHQDGLLIRSNTSDDFFAWQDIACLELKQSNHLSIRFTLITRSPIHVINFYFTSWLQLPLTKKSLVHPTHANLNPFWDKLEHYTRDSMQKHILQNQSQQNNFMVTQLTIDPEIHQTLHRKYKRIVMIVAISISIITILICSLLLWREFAHRSANIQGQEQSFSGTNFKAIDNKVYIFKQGEGYFQLPDIQANQFTGLPLENLTQRADELYSNVGKTTQHVYWQNHLLVKLNAESVEYLGNDYTKDHHYVYFQNFLLPHADSESFDAILHPTFNALGYFYAKDKQYVYYKTLKLNHLVPQFSQAFNNSDQYIHDHDHVYYQGQELPKLNANKTQIFVGENRFSNHLNLATDGHHFYLNAEQLPQFAYYKFFGKKAIERSKLKILGVQKNSPYPGNYSFIFCDENTIYVYDEFYQRLRVLYHFKHNASLLILGDRYFKYGTESYRITETLSRTKGARSSGTTTHGFHIQLLREHDKKIIASYFSRHVYQFSPKKFMAKD